MVDFKEVEKVFSRALKSNRESKSVTTELLRKRVPLHFGGMSDPFQPAEKKERLSLKFLKLTRDYNYPVQISTKTANLGEEYFNALNPSIHAFQVSLMGTTDEFIREYEKRTPLPMQRIRFIRELKERGFWVGLRLQPLIDFNEAIKVVEEVGDDVDFIGVEHIKTPTDNKDIRAFLEKKIGVSNFYRSPLGNRGMEIKPNIKKRNIEALRGYCKCPIGAADNDLHGLSDTRNCCGLDTINENFSGWLKYNSLAIGKGEKDPWYPRGNVSGVFNSECRVRGYNFKDYVDKYIEENKGFFDGDLLMERQTSFFNENNPV